MGSHLQPSSHDRMNEERKISFLQLSEETLLPGTVLWVTVCLFGNCLFVRRNVCLLAPRPKLE